MAAITYTNYQNNRSMMRRTAPPVGERTAALRNGNDGRHQSAPQPSRLQQMQAQFQKNLLLEKEKKLTAVLNQGTPHHPERTLTRKDKMAAETLLGSVGKKGVVREFFKERRQMEKNQTTEKLIPPTTHLQKLRSEQEALHLQEQIKREELRHFSQTHRKEQSPKLRAGYSKHKPLAPIKHPSSDDRINHHPACHEDTKDQVSLHHDDIKLPKREPHHLKQTLDSGSVVPRKQSGNRQKAREDNRIGVTGIPPRRLPKVTNVKKPSPAKLTDFQKWQMEQDQQRDARLQNYADNLKAERKERPLRGTLNDKEESRLISLKDQGHEKGGRKNVQERLKRESEDLSRREKELEAMIAKHQKELAKLQMDDSDDGDESEEELSNASVHYASEEQIIEEQYIGMQQNHTRNQTSGSRQVEEYEEYGHSYHYDQHVNKTEDLSKTSCKYIQKSHGEPKMEKNVTGNNKTKTQDDGKEQQYGQNYDREETNFYAQAVSDLPEDTKTMDLRLCQICGRKFAVERLSKHVKICQKTANTKRKVFDSTRHRTKGTEFSEYVKKGRHLKQPNKKPTNNWRKKHEQFVHAVRDARKVQAHIARGGKLSDLPPPPPAENPDYQQCPYCKRKFNPSAAERHIPHCKTAKSRPKPPPRR